MSSSGSSRYRGFLLALRLLLTATARRTRATPTATIAVIVALCIPISLAVIVPSYANAAGVRILATQIERQERQTQRPALALLFRAVRGTKPLAWRAIQAGDSLIQQNAAAFLQIPIARMTRHIRTIPLPVFATTGATDGQPLATLPVATLDGVDDLIRISAGRAPVAGSDPIETMVSRAYANQTGLNIGDTYVVSAKDRLSAVQVTVVGIWEPLPGKTSAWLYDPETLTSLLLVASADMVGPVAAAFPDGVAQAAWYLEPAAVQFAPGQIGVLETRIRTLAQEMEKIPAKLERSPLNAFAAVNTTIAALTIRTGLISAPVALLAFFFVVQLAAITYDRRKDTYTLLRSRGMTVVRLLVVGAVEWAVYIVLATIPAIPLGLAAAGVMLRTQSFLRVGGPTVAFPGLPTDAWVVMAGVWLVVLAIGVQPILNASRRTLSDSGKSRRSDVVGAVLRIVFEVVVLCAVGYAYYLLQTRQTTDVDLFSDPLTLALPVLTALAVALVTNRVLPLLFRLAQRLARSTDSLVALLALQTIARRPERLQTTVLLLTLTLGVGGYVASMAATVDQATLDGIGYRVGADTVLVETATSRRGTDGAPVNGDVYLLTPLGAHAAIPGVIQYSPVAAYSAQLAAGNQQRSAQLLAIDRQSFAAVVPHFRDKWLGTGNSLGGLLNGLAQTRNGAIFSAGIARTAKIGDRVAVTLDIDGTQVSTTVVVVGIVTGWPGQYDADSPFVVVNQAFLSDEMGFTPPSDVWLTRDTDTAVGEIVSAVRGLGIPLLDVIDRAELLQIEYDRPERQGLFGMLSVGFVAASALSIMAIFVGALTVMRQRTIELGMLQALGMPNREAIRAMALEQGLLVGWGVLTGLVAALVTTVSILPALRTGVAPHPDVPAPTIVTAWGTVATMLGLYCAAMALTALIAFRTLQRLRIADAIKLGDEN